MPRKTGRNVDHRDDGTFSTIVEQGWLAFVVLGLFLVGLRLYNIRQRSVQRKLLREAIMAEVGYGAQAPLTAGAAGANQKGLDGMRKRGGKKR
eukprot:gene8833-6216_t